ncbi:MAG: hypothetical protein FJ146_08490 [Deltaproteobacteria bacterium]|nr:hypothetical protein [Deltaproteobacteria bacterium]
MFTMKQKITRELKRVQTTKSASRAATLSILFVASLTSNIALASSPNKGRAVTNLPPIDRNVRVERARPRIMPLVRPVFRPVAPVSSPKRDSLAFQGTQAVANPMPREYVYPGSVVLVLFGLALVLTSIVSLMRQRQIVKTKMLLEQAKKNKPAALPRAAVKKPQSIKIPPTPVHVERPVATNNARSLTLADLPPKSEPKERVNVRRKPCSLERFTQIEHAVDVAVARMLESKFEIAPQDWELIRGFWSQAVTVPAETAKAEGVRMTFEPASVDDFVEIQLEVTRVTRESLEILFGISETEWLKMKLYWYQRFPKDESLALSYRQSRAQYMFSMNATAA